MRTVCKRPKIDIALLRGRIWFKQRETLDVHALRRTRKIFTRLGRTYKVSEKKLDKVIDPNRLHNKKPYDTIRREMDLDISTNAL